MTNSETYTSYTLLGCGVIVIHDQKTSDKMAKAGYKIRKISGKNVGITLFYKFCL